MPYDENGDFYADDATPRAALRVRDFKIIVEDSDYQGIGKTISGATA